MPKLTLVALSGAMLMLAMPGYAARGSGASMGNVVMSGAGQTTARTGFCRHQRCECARRKPCKIRKGWFAEGLDPLIR